MKRTSSRSTHIPRVLAIISTRSNYGPSVLSGIFAHIAAHGEWGLEIIRSTTDFTRETVEKAIAHKTEGCIIALNEGNADAYRAIADSALPFVTVETYSDMLMQRRYDAHHIRIDNPSFGRDAARNFLRQGRYSSFGFVSPRNERPWSQARKEGFIHELTRRGRQASDFAFNPTADAVGCRGDLAKWLRRLEKPTAVLAADDAIALEVIQAAQSAHLRIPAEVALLGIDNEPLICENTKPALSSIQPPFTEAGRMAADMLSRLMRRQVSQMPTTVGTTVVRGRNEIAIRASTRPESSAGLLVQQAIAFIQENARHGIGIEDIRKHLGVSRALMDLRFREIRNESVLAVLTEARLKELKQALKSTDEPIGRITVRLGWTSPNYPKRLFKKRFGCSMLAWRKSNRD